MKNRLSFFYFILRLPPFTRDVTCFITLLGQKIYEKTMSYEQPRVNQEWINRIWSQFVALTNTVRKEKLLFNWQRLSQPVTTSTHLIERVKKPITNPMFMQAWHFLKHQEVAINLKRLLISNFFIKVYHGFYNRMIKNQWFSKLFFVKGYMPYFSEDAGLLKIWIMVKTVTFSQSW